MNVVVFLFLVSVSVAARAENLCKDKANLMCGTTDYFFCINTAEKKISLQEPGGASTHLRLQNDDAEQSFAPDASGDLTIKADDEISGQEIVRDRGHIVRYTLTLIHGSDHQSEPSYPSYSTALVSAQEGAQPSSADEEINCVTL